MCGIKHNTTQNTYMFKLGLTVFFVLVISLENYKFHVYNVLDCCNHVNVQ